MKYLLFSIFNKKIFKMKNNRLVALALLEGTCLWSKSFADGSEPYLTHFDDDCTGYTYICGVVEG